MSIFSGFRVQDLGFRVSGFGFGFQGLGFGVWGVRWSRAQTSLRSPDAARTGKSPSKSGS